MKPNHFTFTNQRYSRPEMLAVWSEETKFGTWLTVLQTICRAQAELELVPEKLADEITSVNSVAIPRLREIEKLVCHEMIAFLTAVSEDLSPETNRFLHYGLTSSDIIDTAFSLQLRTGMNVIKKSLKRLETALLTLAIEHKFTTCMGRTHGIHAEPTTFGLKMLGFYVEMKRNQQRLAQAEKEISTCAVSGVVGNYSSLPRDVEKIVAKKLNLTREDVSTQVIPRDRHAMLFATLAVVASSLERLAVEIRHLQRSEVGEVREFFSSSQKGSSAMPHKCNPILSENVTGLARLVRQAVTPALENVVLWHERDMSHSSVERVMTPQTFILLDFALNRMADIIENCEVDAVRMQENLKGSFGTFYSQRLLHSLIKAGIGRHEAYLVVQEIAQAVYADVSFEQAASEQTRVKTLLTSKQLDEVFSTSFHLARVEEIFAKICAKNS